MSRCPTCDEFLWQSGRHTCPPIFLVWCPEDGESEENGARPVYASDAEAAAEKWAEDDDWGSEHRIVGGHEPIVHVRNVADRSVSMFRVRGEALPSYSATEIMPKAGGAS